MHPHYRDMMLDVDSMSYEELLALEDRMGFVSTGLSEEALLSSLTHSKYFLFIEENALKESCSICQEDYEEEDELGTLDCGHSFHIACIEQWLRCKNICPICKSTGLCTRLGIASFPQFSM
ncbi:zf-RING_2 domain-containing protein [Cephalotus follicularis]|uniref:RING-type E3 ubiquitin transferase n=1 Tax=Cephalotus follicularis TaxID=3775 RepID=A0A1Q3C140_CEPFO|nr:zf-RING_2 domain-containing protein [Cephalotus follicularis]